MALAVCGGEGEGVLVGALDAGKGTLHNLFGVRLPFIIILSSLMISTSYLVKMAMQSLSQSCPKDRREPVLRSSNINAFLACSDNLSDKLRCAFDCGVMVCPFATATFGPVVFVTFLQADKAAGCRK